MGKLSAVSTCPDRLSCGEDAYSVKTNIFCKNFIRTEAQKLP